MFKLWAQRAMKLLDNNEYIVFIRDLDLSWKCKEQMLRGIEWFYILKHLPGIDGSQTPPPFLLGEGTLTFIEQFGGL
jgi:hypothetical protein